MASYVLSGVVGRTRGCGVGVFLVGLVWRARYFGGCTACPFVVMPSFAIGVGGAAGPSCGSIPASGGERAPQPVRLPHSWFLACPLGPNRDVTLPFPAAGRSAPGASAERSALGSQSVSGAQRTPNPFCGRAGAAPPPPARRSPPARRHARRRRDPAGVICRLWVNEAEWWALYGFDLLPLPCEGTLSL